MENRKQRIKKLLAQLSKGVFEKDEIMALSLLAAVAGESVFLLGPPGVAKSLIARRLKFAFRNGNSFEYLMNRFSTPDEIFGPVSIKKLKDEDKYERLTEHYMPGASVVFLDEIWKAGPSIQNALLTILNEKIYRNGEQEIKVNIRAVISASNELPPGGESLDALWDRFLLRFIITEIRKSGNFINMITSTDDVYEDNIEEGLKLTLEEAEGWSSEISKVEVPLEVVNTIQLVKTQLEKRDEQSSEGFDLYDRRWKKIIRLLRTSAFLNERKVVDLMDCFLMIHCLWQKPEHIAVAQQIVSDTIRKHGYSIAMNLTGLKKEIFELEKEIERETRIKHGVTREELYLIEHKYYEILNLESYLEGRYIKQSDYDGLALDELRTISIFDVEYKLTYKVKAKKSASEHRIELVHNAQNKIFEMRTFKTETEELILKKPHPLVEKYWDEQCTEFMNYISEQQRRIKEEAPQETEGLEENLFVNPELGNIVLANLNDAANTLGALELRTEKLQYFYKNLD